MKVIVLGGAGDVGSKAVEDLAISEGVEMVTIADKNTKQAKKIADGCHGQATVRVLDVDADDHAGLVEAMKGHDVATSALGPFYRFESKLVRAAIEAGVDYASVCDESDAAEAVFRDFNHEARQKGRTILSGLGASPGITNVGARLLSRRFDTFRRLDVNCYQPLDAGGGEAVLRHMLHIMHGDITTFRDGAFRTVAACSESHIVNFPRYGRIKVWNMGHSEPVTVPRFFPEIKEVNFFMGFGHGAMPLVAATRRGILAGSRRTNFLVHLADVLDRLFAPQRPSWGALRIDAWGSVNGTEEHHVLCGVGEMRDSTGLSLSIGTQMLARGELFARHGVFAPEGCIEPAPFLDAMRSKGIMAYEDLRMTREIEGA